MAIFNFTGANGDPLPSGLTARNGTFEIQDNHAVATSPEPANPRWVFTLEGTADGNLTAPIFLGADSGSSAGFVLRYNPADGSHIFVNMSLGNDEVRVYKGGSWRDRAYWIDPAQRRYFPQDMATDYIGFRCAVSRVGSKTQKGGKKRN